MFLISQSCQRSLMSETKICFLLIALPQLVETRLANFYSFGDRNSPIRLNSAAIVRNRPTDAVP